MSKKIVSEQQLADWMANQFSPEIQRLIISATDDIMDRAKDSPLGKVKFVIKASISLSGKSPESDLVTEVDVVYPKKRDKSSLVQDDPDQTKFQFGGEVPAQGDGDGTDAAPAPDAPKGGKRKRGVKVAA